MSNPRVALQSITFTNTTTGGPFSTLEWDLGTGPRPPGATASHTFAAAGTFDVRLRVVAASGASDEQVTAVVVTPAAPAASFTAAVAPSPARTYTFESTSTGGPFTTIAWDFGHPAPNNTATGASVTHTFPAGSSFVVRLAVWLTTGSGPTSTTAHDHVRQPCGHVDGGQRRQPATHP